MGWIYHDLNLEILDFKGQNKFKFITIRCKALKIRYNLMDCYLVDIHLLWEAFGGARILKFDTKPNDDITIFANVTKRWEVFNTYTFE